MKPGTAWINGLWIALVVIWLISALRIKRAERRVSGWRRVVQSILMVAGAFLLFDSDLNAGVLGFPLLPDGPGRAYAGIAMTALGIAFAVWARFVLGGNWSSQVTLKHEHELIRSGPYRFVRHPIYSGILFALLGTAIFVGELRGLIAVALFVTGWWLKAQLEEALMIEHFGEQYRRYQCEVKAIIPFVL